MKKKPVKKVENKIKAAEHRLKKVENKVDKYIEDNPKTAVAIAAGVGTAIGASFAALTMRKNGK